VREELVDKFGVSGVVAGEFLDIWCEFHVGIQSGDAGGEPRRRVSTLVALPVVQWLPHWDLSPHSCPGMFQSLFTPLRSSFSAPSISGPPPAEVGDGEEDPESPEAFARDVLVQLMRNAIDELKMAEDAQARAEVGFKRRLLVWCSELGGIDSLGDTKDNEAGMPHQGRVSGIGRISGLD
jgi:hypothetical protein